MKKDIISYFPIRFVIIVVLCFFNAVSAYCFIVPNGFAPGGISGIASIIYNLVLPLNERLAKTVLNPGVTVFVMNIPLLILSMRHLSKNFTVNTALCVIFYAGFMAMFSWIDFPQFVGGSYESGIMIIAALSGGALGGICLGLMIRFSMCIGGTDIIANLIYKKNPLIDLTYLIFLCDIVVVLFSGVLGLKEITSSMTQTEIMVAILSPMMYSFISMFTTAKIGEVIHSGLESSVVFNIITVRPKEISDVIIGKLQRSATIIKVQGAYTCLEKSLIICVVRKRQLPMLKREIKNIDGDSFVYITNTREVQGLGFYT